MNSVPRVLVTRAAHQAGALSEALRAAGFAPVEVPLLEIGPPSSLAALDQAIATIESYDWLILTSANAVRALLDCGAAHGSFLDRVQRLKVAVVGEATARAARKAGLPVALVPESYVAESLAAALGNEVRGKRVLLARAEVARDVIPDSLRAAGAQLDVADAYRNVLPAAAPAQLKAALQEKIPAATFTSSSSVEHLREAAAAAGLGWPLEGVRAVSIGPITSQTLRAAGWEPAAEALPYDLAGLVAALARLFFGI